MKKKFFVFASILIIVSLVLTGCKRSLSEAPASVPTEDHRGSDFLAIPQAEMPESNPAPVVEEASVVEEEPLVEEVSAPEPAPKGMVFLVEDAQLEAIESAMDVALYEATLQERFSEVYAQMADHQYGFGLSPTMFGKMLSEVELGEGLSFAYYPSLQLAVLRVTEEVTFTDGWNYVDGLPKFRGYPPVE